MSTLPDTVAIDIVLLPPGPVMDEAIRINQALIMGNSDGEIILSREGAVPHISVAMAAVRRDNLPELTRAVERIVQHCTPMTLTIDAIEHQSVSSGDWISAFHVLRPEIIQLFHKTVMNAVSRYAVADVTEEIFAGERVTASTVDCLRRFPETSSFSRYSPHITLGFGEIEPLLPGLDFPIRFEVTRAAIYRLGNHCTCREILAEFEVKRNNR